MAQVSQSEALGSATYPREKRTAQAQDFKTPFRFRDLPLEVRNTIYQILFAGACVRVSGQNIDDDDEYDEAEQLEEARSEMKDQLWPSEDVLATRQCERDDYNPDLKDLLDDIPDEYDLRLIKPQSATRLNSYVQNQRRHNWTGEVDGQLVPLIEAMQFSEATMILGTCKAMRDEAQSILVKNMRLVVFDNELSISDLPPAPVNAFLTRIQEATLDLNQIQSDPRYPCKFDLRQMTMLKKLHLKEPEAHILYVTVSHHNVHNLVEYIYGGKDNMFVARWFELEQMLVQAELNISNGQPPRVQELLREKNRARYWLRNLLHDKSKRDFQVIKRAQYIVRAQLLKGPSTKKLGVRRSKMVSLVSSFHHS